MSVTNNLRNVNKSLARSGNNLLDRTTNFGRDVIVFCKSLKPDIVSTPIISQIVRSSTSIGANYREANAAGGKKDFRNKIVIAKKETSETEHWLTMLASCYPEKNDELRKLWQENHELLLIFSKILITTDSS